MICTPWCSNARPASSGELVGDLAELHGLAFAQLPVVVADAEVRGVVEESQAASTTAWVADHGWHARRQAPTVAKAAKLLRRPELGAVAESMLTADIDPATAVVVGAEFDKLVKDLKPDAGPVVLDHMLNVAADDGPGGVRQLRQEIIARWGEQGDFEEQQEKCRRHIDLTAGRESSAGVWDYRLTDRQRGPRHPGSRHRHAGRTPTEPGRHPRCPAGRAAPR